MGSIHLKSIITKYFKTYEIETNNTDSSGSPDILFSRIYIKILRSIYLLMAMLTLKKCLKIIHFKHIQKYDYKFVDCFLCLSRFCQP